VHARTPNSPAYTTSKHAVLGFHPRAGDKIGEDPNGETDAIGKRAQANEALRMLSRALLVGHEAAQARFPSQIQKVWPKRTRIVAPHGSNLQDDPSGLGAASTLRSSLECQMIKLAV